MPHADPEKRKEVKRRWFQKKYEQDPLFREIERERALAAYYASPAAEKARRNRAKRKGG